MSRSANRPGPGARPESCPASRGRVLVTGASGLVGSRTLEPLSERGYEVHAVARSSGSAVGVIWHRVDLLDERSMRELVADVRTDYLLHLAWETEHGGFWSSPENLDWVAASLRLLRAFREAGGHRAVLAGTCAEYDWSSSVECCLEVARDGRRATPEHPATLYGVAKRAAHQVAAAYARETGLSLAWGRIFFLYGPGEDDRRLVPSVARALLEGREARTSAGTQLRDFMHVDDVARGFVELLGGTVEGPVNIASGRAVAISHVIDLIAGAAGREDLLRVGALLQRVGEPDCLVADTGRLNTEVGFQPRITLEQGIAGTLAWWRDHLVKGSDGGERSRL